MDIIKSRVSCDRTLSLLQKALVVGYLDPKTKRYVTTDIGTPQGSVLSPLLANIVLHELDQYITKEVILHRGRRRRTNPEYNSVAVIRDPNKHPNATGEEKAEALLRSLPRYLMKDKNYRRSLYIRYADDFVYLLEGPKEEAIIIKEKIKSFLRDKIGLELNDQKTLITHITEGFNFLGAYIKMQKRVGFMMKNKTTTGKVITMRASVCMPTKSLIEKLIKAGFAHRNHLNVLLAKPKTELINLDHCTIIQFYNSKIHGLINYYSFACNRIETQNLIWILR